MASVIAFQRTAQTAGALGQCRQQQGAVGDGFGTGGATLPLRGKLGGVTVTVFANSRYKAPGQGEVAWSGRRADPNNQANTPCLSSEQVICVIFLGCAPIQMWDGASKPGLTLAQPVVMQRPCSRFDFADLLLMGVYIQVRRQFEIVLLGAPGDFSSCPACSAGNGGQLPIVTPRT